MKRHTWPLIHLKTINWKIMVQPLLGVLLFLGLWQWGASQVQTSLGTLPDGLPRFALPQVPFTASTLGLILPTALAISLVATRTDSDDSRMRISTAAILSTPSWM